MQNYMNRFLETSKRWRCLSKVDVLGFMDFWTLTISLESLNSRDTSNITIGNLSVKISEKYDFYTYERHKKVLPLAVHEYTHFIDATSTVWGLSHLNQLHRSLSTSPNAEHDFFKLKETYDHMRCIRLPDYYTVINSGNPQTKPWISNVTSGLRFKGDGTLSNIPILFVRFWNADEQPIARSPISLISLLEASAMAKEIEVRIDLIKRLGSDEGAVEIKLMEKELLEYIYNPNLAEYSVCFHLLANSQGQSDLALTSQAAGWLTRFILNLPKKSFSTISKNFKTYANKVRKTEIELGMLRIQTALDNFDRGAMFYFLVTMLDKGKLTSMQSFRNEVILCLRLMNLSEEKILRAAIEEITTYLDNINSGDSEHLKAIAKCGKKII
jgi:hypothetical protein